jgi:hypothetical protein
MSVQTFLSGFKPIHWYTCADGCGEVSIMVSQHDDLTVLLESIMTEDVGQGYGSEALDWLCDLADVHGLRIVGQMERLGGDGLTKTQLGAWYRRHGFAVTRKYGLDGKYVSTDIERKPTATAGGA